MAAEYQSAIKSEVEKWPGVSVTFEKRSKHNAAVLHYAGKSRFVIYPDTPSDAARGALNMLTDVRKELSGIGAVKHVPAKSARSKSRKVKNVDRPIKPLTDMAAPRDNPFAALASIQFAQPAPTPEPAPKKPWWRRIWDMFA